MRASYWILGCLGLLTLLALSISVGVMSILSESGQLDAQSVLLLLESRLPRTLAALIVGASLAVSGVIMQVMVHNRFVEPMTVGSGQGAALGILLAMVLMPRASIFWQMGFASALAMLCSLGYLGIIRRLPATQPLLVPLVGLIYGGVIGATVVFFAYQFDLLQFIDIWMNGEFSGVVRGRYELLWGAALAAALTYVIADQLAIVGLGKETSLNLGLNYTQVVMLGLLSVSLVSALTVVTIGIIPFVGLIIPNLISRMMGDNLRQSLPVMALLGGGFVLLADIIGRIIRYPFEIPVSVMFGVLGAGVFLRMLYQRPAHGG